MFQFLKEILAGGDKSVVAVTHDIDLANRMDRRVHLVDGRIVSDENRVAAPVG